MVIAGDCNKDFIPNDGIRVIISSAATRKYGLQALKSPIVCEE